ncbi:MAG: PEP/pyruvate-binding domain-containing protein, partial [Gammaproteobacteria bacterium]
EDYLVVRSSALGEDGAAASFAGQHATYYYVSAETLGKAVVDCWMSLWSEPAIAYRRQHRLDDESLGMAVIIQKMVQSERSGVCFTRDPTGSLPHAALVESTWGLGAALVDGRVSPDRFWVSAEAIEDRKVARKRLKVGEALKDPDEQRLEPVPLDRQAQPTLTDIEVRQIVDVANRIATTRGEPQDVEWAIDGDELFILQSRPLTITLIPPDQQSIEGRWILFKPAAENFSEPFTPMTIDLLRRVVPPFGRFIQGRYYVDVDVMDKLLPWSLDDQAQAGLLLMRDPLPADVPLDWRRVFRIGGILGIGYLCNGITWHRTAALPLDSLAAFETRCRDVLANDGLDPLDSLIRLVLNDHPLRPMGEFAIQANVSSIRYFVLLDVLKMLVSRFAPDFDPNTLALICSGGQEMLSQQMVEGIGELAALANQDGALASAMQSDSANLLALTVKLPDDHPFAVALSRFLGRFGHRGVREMDLASPRWREDPTTVLTMVRNYLTRDGEESASAVFHQADRHGRVLAAQDELHQALSTPWQRRIVDYLVRRIRYFVTLRENTRHYHMMGFAAVREKLKRLEHGLIQAGRLRCEDDIFFLEHPEAVALEVGALEWRDVEDRIRERRLR